MTMTLPASLADTSSLKPTLVMLVVLIGAIQSLNWLTGPDTLLGPLHPIVGIGAIGFALAGRLRLGIVALALLALSQWAGFFDITSLVTHGIDLTGDPFVNAKAYVQPVLAVAAIVAAWFNRYLAAATVAVMLPAILDWLGVAAFAIGVAIYGF